jgi:hypothetical protein
MTANRVCNETLSRAGVGVFTRVASQALMIDQPVTSAVSAIQESRPLPTTCTKELWRSWRAERLQLTGSSACFERQPNASRSAYKRVGRRELREQLLEIGEHRRVANETS